MADLAPPKRKDLLRRRVRAQALLSVMWLVRQLPIRGAQAVGRFLGRLGWAVGGKQRRLVLRQLALAFPALSDVERNDTGQRCFMHLGEIFAETAYGPKLLGADLEAFVKVDPEVDRLLREMQAGGRGIVAMSGHVGNWELLCRRLALIADRTTIVARELNTRALSDWFDRYRLPSRVRTIWRGRGESTSAPIARVMEENGAIGLLIDQDTKSRGFFVPFFGVDAWTPRGPGDLAIRHGAPVIWAFDKRLPDGTHYITGYRIDVPATGDAEADARAVLVAGTKGVEDAIRATPEQWVWIHDRWKTRPKTP